jgi:hypothetical protein
MGRTGLGTNSACIPILLSLYFFGTGTYHLSLIHHLSHIRIGSATTSFPIYGMKAIS